MIASITQNLRLPGQYFDSETGFHYNGFRDYVPGLGRYLESDPVGLAGGFNPYRYVKGNPVKSMDKWGLCPCQMQDDTSLMGRANQIVEPVVNTIDEVVPLADWEKFYLTKGGDLAGALTYKDLGGSTQGADNWLDTWFGRYTLSIFGINSPRAFANQPTSLQDWQLYYDASGVCTIWDTSFPY